MTETKSRLERFLYHNILTVLLVALGLGIIGIGNVVDGIDKTLVFFHVWPNALEIARDDERGRFSRDLMRLLWHQLAAMDRFREKAIANYSRAEQDSAWEEYVKVYDEWQKELMVNIIGLKQYYDNRKSHEFESDVRDSFNSYHNCIEHIRNPIDQQFTCEITKAINFEKECTNKGDACRLEIASNTLKSNLYCFITGLPEKDKSCFRRLVTGPSNGESIPGANPQ